MKLFKWAAELIVNRIIGYKSLSKNIRITHCMQALCMKDDVNKERYEYTVAKMCYSIIIVIVGLTAIVLVNENKLVVVIMTIVGAVGVHALIDERLNEKMKQRNEQMIQDYSKIVSEITMLNEAGLSTYKIIKNIVTSYDREQSGVRYAYEELLLAANKIDNKESELDVYNRFGQRCKSHCYMRLGALMSQNIKKGNKELTTLLQSEVIQAFEERKALAIKQADKAATKLLIPMIMMLVVTIAIIVVPAFLSMNF